MSATLPELLFRSKATPAPALDKKTICLVMIVRDEAPIIARCLDSVLPYIDRWRICDTGSKDATKQIISEKLRDKPGKLYDVPWKNFGHNRTEAVRRARGVADYLLFLGANMELVVRGDLPALTAPAYDLELRSGDFAYRLPLLIRGDQEWSYVGVTHEYLTPYFEPEQMDAWSIIKHLDGARNARRFVEDAQLLEDDLADKARSIFYLAQTYKDLGRPDKAVGLYRLRSELSGWEEEAWYAHWQWGEQLVALRRLDEAARVLWAAHKRRPTRVEPLRSLIALGCTEYQALADSLPVPNDRLFLHLEMYAGQAVQSAESKAR